MMSNDKITPAYNFEAHETPLVLKKVPVRLTINNTPYEGAGEVMLKLLPKPEIAIRAIIENINNSVVLAACFDSNSKPSFAVDGHDVKGFISQYKDNNSSESLNIKWSPSSEPVFGAGDNATPIKRAIFHLFNYLEVKGEKILRATDGPSSAAVEHISLNSEIWKIELRSLVSTANNIKILGNEGGYRITHIGGIEKLDGSVFTEEELKECLNALRMFFSFSRGDWCAPVCTVGFDGLDNRVWESWTSPSDALCTSIRWFEPNNKSQLPLAFTTFMNKWSISAWRDTLNDVIYWYLNANNSSQGIDTGIILTQTAIERLSFQYAVNEKHLISPDGFKKLRASDKFRLLFSSLNIPLHIPLETSGLQAFAKKSKVDWLDAPHALTEIRNSLVHPDHKRQGQFGEAYCVAWNLGQWYLEMGILAVCGYTGTCRNRLKGEWVGDVEDVPWMKK